MWKCFAKIPLHLWEQIGNFMKWRCTEIPLGKYIALHIPTVAPRYPVRTNKWNSSVCAISWMAAYWVLYSSLSMQENSINMSYCTKPIDIAWGINVSRIIAFVWLLQGQIKKMAEHWHFHTIQIWCQGNSSSALCRQYLFLIGGSGMISFLKVLILCKRKSW